jgi:hypothetical protein
MNSEASELSSKSLYVRKINQEGELIYEVPSDEEGELQPYHPQADRQGTSFKSKLGQIRRTMVGFGEKGQSLVANRLERRHFRGFISDVVAQIDLDILDTIYSHKDKDQDLVIYSGFEKSRKALLSSHLSLGLHEVQKIVVEINRVLTGQVGEEVPEYRVDADEGVVLHFPSLKVLSRDELVSSKFISQRVNEELTKLLDNNTEELSLTDEAMTSANLRIAVVNKLYPIYLKYLDFFYKTVERNIKNMTSSYRYNHGRRLGNLLGSYEREALQKNYPKKRSDKLNKKGKKV